MKTSLITINQGDKVRLKKLNPDATGPISTKEDSVEPLEKLREQIARHQEALYAEGKRSLLLVFQAMDTGGKDGAIKHLLTGINPAGVQVASFKAPSLGELAHDYLWRIHAQAPARGMIGVWNRSHYEDVLITRVHKLIDGKTCKQRYGQINAFEEILSANGTKILKFFLFISQDEQKERLQARLDNPEKRWKFNPGDLEEREQWDAYMEAYEDAINATSTDEAPWHIVPANKKWARNVALSQIVAVTLQKMAPQFPKADFDAANIVIR